VKIDITSIIRAHWTTLYNAEHRISVLDIVVFYVTPLLAAAVIYYADMKVKLDHYNASITFFGIFLALLLNIQVAIFAIFQRKWDFAQDKRQASIQERELADRKTLLGELNTNISYLTIFSCLALVLFLTFYVADLTSGLAPSIAVFLYLHFLLTFMMIIKRAHALFQKEYRDR